MEIDGDLEIVRVAIATGPLLDGSDLGVQAFSDSVGDAMLKVGQHIGQMSGNQLGGLDHGHQAAVGRPEIPALPELGGPGLRLVAPQLPQRLLQRPGTGCLEFHRLQFIEAIPGLIRHVLRVGQPQVLASGQRIVAGLHQRLVLLLSHLVYRIDDMTHDMEAIKDHLWSAPGTLFRQALM